MNWTSPKCREIARRENFAVHAKKDSTGICFIGERKFRDFLQRFIPAQPGAIVIPPKASDLGEHSGLMYYTIGQTTGSWHWWHRKPGNDDPWYVVAKALDSNQLVVAQGVDNPLLFHSHCRITDLHWIADTVAALPYECSAKIRYRQQDSRCTLRSMDADIAEIEFAEPQRAITPGQALVLYQGEQMPRWRHHRAGLQLMNRIENQTLALAAMFQAATLVNELALHGNCESDDFTAVSKACSRSMRRRPERRWAISPV